MNDHLIIAGEKFNSRLMVGTGKHRNFDEMVKSIDASGAEIITVAIRRLDLKSTNKKKNCIYLSRWFHENFVK